ncbi:hypothetical protein STXM2123_3251 [Streptomyces sp. F-3]|nr:hypothetical protein STXM2123_3251 [Streptomyces sp. F-3]
MGGGSLGTPLLRRVPGLGGRGGLPALTVLRVLLRAPLLLAPGLIAGGRRGRGLAARSARHARQQGLTSVGGQHDAFVRGPRRGPLALSTLRHRDSYVWGTFGIVGSRYRVP